MRQTALQPMAVCSQHVVRFGRQQPHDQRPRHREHEQWNTANWQPSHGHWAFQLHGRDDSAWRQSHLELRPMAKHATINGTVQGTSIAQPITLSGYIKGTGTLTNVNFTGTYSPGLSPAIVTAGNLGFGSTSTLIMELGGTTPGSGYDQIQASGTLALGGTLNVSLINSFVPQLGQSFDILDWTTLGGSRSGTFSALQLPALSSGPLGWDTSHLYSTGVLTVTNTVPGDFNRDGHVDAADILAMQQALANPTAYQAAHSNLTAAQLLDIEDVNGDGKFNNADLQSLLTTLKSGGGSADSVPEPASLVLVGLGTLAIGIHLRSRKTAVN
jgi:hypothetical protein